MSNSGPYKILGVWYSAEGAIEVTVPIFLAGTAWYQAVQYFGTPTAARPLTTLELLAILGACAGVTGWAVARQMFLGNKKRPGFIALACCAVVAASVWATANRTQAGFERRCASDLQGKVVTAQTFEADTSLWKLCKVGGVPSNHYLEGTLFRPKWDGRIGPFLGLYLLGMGAVAGLGFRDRRIRPTRVPNRILDVLKLAPAAGSASGAGEPKIKEGGVQACANATLWGETCGQLYSIEKKFQPGEWCIRCNQPYRKCERELTFKVVSLYTDEIDVLNGIERLDTVSWRRGEPMPPDARISGIERWTTFGHVTVPDVLTVSQLLSLVNEKIAGWEGNPKTAKAAGLAKKRASKICAWVWQGSVSHRLTFARPTQEAMFAWGPVRLRDLNLDGAEELWLQLDIGLFPLEVRVGFKKTFLEDGREPEVQNSKSNIWIPVGPRKMPKGKDGLWVDRVDGEALRTWVSTERLREKEEKGSSIPLPYCSFQEGNKPAPLPKAGSLDFVRMPLDAEGMEPIMERAIGASIAEWDWLEPDQIQLLRAECLVLTDNRT